jgi:DNA polymerase-3 subunit delta'
LVAAEEVGGALKVDQVRRLARQLSLTPYEGRWRIALLLRFHESTLSAANALLKTLEEPAEKVVLLLTARSPELLLPTVVSRCEGVPLRSVAVPALAAALEARGEPSERALLLAGLSAGRPGWALQWRESPGLLEQREATLDDLLSLLRMSRAERFAYVDRMTKVKDGKERRRRAVGALETWLGLWRDAMLESFEVEGWLGNPDRRQDLRRLAAEVAPGAVLKALKATVRTLEALTKNANLRLALETLMLDLPSVQEG